MIRYALRCADGHRFDSWFQSADAFDGLAEKGLVSCAVCGRPDVTKAIMAPQVAAETEAPAPEPSKPLSTPSHPMEAALRAFRAHLEANSTYVGGRFAAEARAMHLGEKADAPIHGEANPDEARALIEDGVPILPIPVLPKAKAN
jgi:hypothetical protein